MRAKQRLLAALTAAVLLGGCASQPMVSNQPPWLAEGGAVNTCLQAFYTIDKRVFNAGVADSQAFRVPGFPFLRVDRFLASYKGSLETETQRNRWVDYLSGLDAQSRAIEIANLGGRQRGETEALDLQDCRQTLIDAVKTRRVLFESLADNATVPDDYRTWQRAVGLYPIVKHFVLAGVERLHERQQIEVGTEHAFDRTNARIRLYGLGSDAADKDDTAHAAVLSRDELDVPKLSAAARERLVRRYSPLWLIEPAGEFDLIGAVRWKSGEIVIDTSSPVVYTHISYTRFDGRVLLQLNYTVWFSSRPKSGPLDILGGRYDGLTVRVTLDVDGRVLALDAMHNCGCYYMAFPSSDLIPTSALAGGDAEPLWLPGTLDLAQGQRLGVRLDSGTHYLRGLHVMGPVNAAEVLDAKNYSALRSIPRDGAGPRSMFGPQGFVAASQRLERWVLWPTGVPSPGAMRQWGHHAIAFVGRRHFDDPDLIDRYFTRAPQ